ncbi:MAG: ComF family protein [Syntrophobacteraceae bacterium]|nr:ComF family protein [Syntrophobacteraceae bacterium]
MDEERPDNLEKPEILAPDELEAASVVARSFIRSVLGSIGWGIKFAGSAIVDLCLPRSCADCQKIGTLPQKSWCGPCWEKIGRIDPPLCPGCGRPFGDAPSSPDHLCGDCIERSFRFDSARSAAIHEGAVRTRVHQFKFGGQLKWTPCLVELLEAAYTAWELPAPDLIVPVPLHLKRLSERGFNQAGVLARELGRKIKTPVSACALVRKNQTLPQTRLKRGERLQNVKGAFEVSDKSTVRGRRILLIDDVFTTGTTLSECAKILKRKGGASEVYALTVTRALPD